MLGATFRGTLGGKFTGEFLEKSFDKILGGYSKTIPGHIHMRTNVWNKNPERITKKGVGR